MATIKYLSNISLENLELQNAKIQVVASDPVIAGSTYEGRIIYNSTDNALKFHNGASSNYWVTLDGSGDISSVAVRPGEGLEVEAGSSTTNSGDFDVTLGLASSVAGTYLGYSAGVINHDNTSRSDTTSTDSPAAGGNFEAVTSVTTNATGHVTAIDVSTVTIPAAPTVNDNQITIDAGTYISLGSGEDGVFTLNQGSDETITLNHDSTSRSNTTSSAAPDYSETFTAIDSITTNSTGHVTAVNTKTVTIPASDNTNTDTLQSISADNSGSSARFLTSVGSASGAQTGFSHSNLTYTPSTETLTVTNLIVSGTSTTVNTEEINLADNIIRLNSNYSGSSPTEDGGIEIERGSVDNASFYWDESTDRWSHRIGTGTEYKVHTEENDVELGTHTSGNYVASISEGTNISISNSAGEGSTHQISVTGLDNYGGWNLKLDGSNTTGGAVVGSGEEVEFLSTTSEHGGITITNPAANDLEFNVVQGTTTKRGALELATNTEASTGTDTARAVTPAGVRAAIDSDKFSVVLNSSLTSVTKSGNTYTVTHDLGTKDVIAQVVDISGASPTYETVFVDTARPSTSTITVDFASTVTNGDYKVLIYKIG